MKFPRSKRAKYFYLLILFLVIGLGIFSFAKVSYAASAASWWDNIAWALAWLVNSVLVNLVGSLLVLMTEFLVTVASYNQFSTSQAVSNGWVIVRDVANSFFVVVLLVIAFSTMLGYQKYGYKALLPKLLIYAILINFSKTIAGLFIDFSQVVMITFVNGFSQLAGGNIIQALQIDQMLNLELGDKPGAIGGTSVLIAVLLSLIMLVIALVLVVIFTVILLFRIVMLWLLVVLAPLAFILPLFPGAQKFGNQWWEEFGKYLIVGPLLAFFLWLSFVTIGDGNAINQLTADPSKISVAGLQGAVSTFSAFGSYIIGVCMLVGGLVLTGKLGVAGGSMAGAAANKIMETGKRAAIAPLKAAGGALTTAEGYIYGKTGFSGFNPMRIGRGIKSAYESTRRRWESEGASIASTRGKELEGEGKVLRGMLRTGFGAPEDFVQNYFSGRGVKKLLYGLKGALPGTKNVAEVRAEAKEKSEGYEAEATLAKNAIGDKEMSYGKRKEAWEGYDGEEAKLDKSISDEEKNQQAIRDRYQGLIDTAVSDTDKKNLQEERDALLEASDKKIDVAEADKIKLFDRTRATAGSEDLIRKDGKWQDEKYMQGQIEKHETDYENFSQEAADQKRLSATLAPGTDFYARRNFRNAISEEVGKLPRESMEATELSSNMQLALVDKNKSQFAALLMKATQDGNDNEVWKEFGFQGDRAGIEEFRKEVLVKKLKMTGQESMSLLSDVGYINEKIGHTAASRLYTVEDGIYRPTTDEEQAAAVTNENLKKDTENFLRHSNRLNLGSESPDGKLKIDLSGKLYIEQNQGKIIDLLRSKPDRINPNLMKKLMQDIGSLQDMVDKKLIPQEMIGLIKRAAGQFEEGKTTGQILEERAKEISGKK